MYQIPSSVTGVPTPRDNNFIRVFLPIQYIIYLSIKLLFCLNGSDLSKVFGKNMIIYIQYFRGSYVGMVILRKVNFYIIWYTVIFVAANIYLSMFVWCDFLRFAFMYVVILVFFNKYWKTL